MHPTFLSENENTLSKIYIFLKYIKISAEVTFFVVVKLIMFVFFCFNFFPPCTVNIYCHIKNPLHSLRMCVVKELKYSFNDFEVFHVIMKPVLISISHFLICILKHSLTL